MTNLAGPSKDRVASPTPRFGRAAAQAAEQGPPARHIDLDGASADEIAEVQRRLWHGGTPRTFVKLEREP